MNATPEVLLVGAVAAVGVLHTVVPDHWVPITLIARQERWTRPQVARAALVAGTGHTVSTLLIGLAVWVAGVAFATRFGTLVSTLSSLALIAFGGWIATSALREMRGGRGDSHGHGHSHGHGAYEPGTPDGFHGPELARIVTDHDALELSIYEHAQPPRFRLSGHRGERAWIETVRGGLERRSFELTDRGDFWESIDEVPEPHAFTAAVCVSRDDRTHTYEAEYAEHDHAHDAPDDSLRAPTPGGRVQSRRTSLLLILGSSPMVEGIPAFFAAGRYGFGLIALMAVVFAIATIATYVGLCVASVASLRRVSFGPLERYGEVLSGAFIAIVGVVFLIFPLM